jgi:hypothetical protein
MHASKSYCALRVRQNAQGTSWWTAAQHEPEPPRAVEVLLAGRAHRVELSPAEAEEALAWAAQIPGWAEEPEKPVFTYRPGTRDGPGSLG